MKPTFDKKTACNSRFAKAGVSCFYNSEVLNSSFVHLMKFSAENPRLRKAANRCTQFPYSKTELFLAANEEIFTILNNQMVKN